MNFFKPKPPKLCVNCKYHRLIEDEYFCTNYDKISPEKHTSLVTGIVTYLTPPVSTCFAVRYRKNLCGPKGRFFKPFENLP